MCGIVGIFARNGAAPRAADLDAMNATLFHRGPDESGSYLDETVGLAMRRLSIIGVGNGRQPIFNEDGTIAVVMNGEIYNYLDVRACLEAAGHRFQTSSDVEVAVHLYEEHGADFVEQMRGMFAFALYDRRARRLILGRDRTGKKPLYYAEHRGALLFASEIKALHANGIVPKTIDPDALESYLAHGFVVGSRTMFAGVHKVPPGSILIASGAETSVRAYWDMPAPDPAAPPSVDTATVRVRELFEEAVRVRLMSEVPLGAFLSGGVDSSAVVSVMSRELGRPVETFAVGFDDTAFDELVHARFAAQLFRTNHHEVMVRGCSPDLLRDINWHHDEPAADPANVPTFCLSRFARDYVTVALTGEGGDELFAGYRHYEFCRRVAAWEASIAGVQQLAGFATSLQPYLGQWGPRRLWKGLWIASLPVIDRPRGLVSVFTDRDVDRLLRRAPHTINGNTYRKRTFRDFEEHIPGTDRIAQAMYVDAKSQLAEQLLMKVDKMTMAASLEARCPFLDQRLIEYVAALPTTMKISSAGRKLLLRRALRGLVPDKLIDRPKHGFEVPIRRWLLSELTPVVDELLLNKDAAVGALVDQTYVAQLWQQLRQREDQQLAKQVWLLLNLAVWHDRHWERATTTPHAACTAGVEH